MYSPYVIAECDRYTPVSYTHLVRKPRTPYGSPGDEVRLFLTEDGYRQALDAQRSQQIKIKRYAHVVEGHILDFKPRKKRRHP